MTAEGEGALGSELSEATEGADTAEAALSDEERFERFERRRQRRRIRLMSVAAGVALALAVSFVTYAVMQANKVKQPSTFATLPTLAPNAKAPGFRLPRLGGGGDVSLASYTGRPVVLNFFGSYCTFCQQELNAFAAVSSKSHSVAFVGIDVEEPSPGKAISMMRTAGDLYPTGLDPDGTVATEYDVQGLPVTVAIDASGRVVGVSVGAQTVASLDRIVATLSK